MVSPRGPRRLRPPGGGEAIPITWEADVAPSQRAGDLARYFDDLDAAIDTGEAWGIKFARAAAQQDLMADIRQRGLEAVEGEALELGYDRRDLRYLDDWIHGPWERMWPMTVVGPGSLLETLADARVPKLLGTPARIRHVEYGSPLLVELVSSGFSLFGIVKIAELVRDWSNKRAADAASVRQANAVARQEEARARQIETHADLAQWAVDETRAKRWPTAAGDLYSDVTPEQLQALTRLAERLTRLELPPGSGQSADDQ
ncbi:hypothetical protein [Streptomyces bluensis]|uniref:hypothetical protein n=1 Tax=Streptomyces bluensis TaxID=33897 RepID=UPI0016747B87|nr:hypothetical protein [Streptomyces bluensis]GGZ69980.1 hypothetical protein GCM10010344_41200 [Streptomyces bluensis]